MHLKWVCFFFFGFYLFCSLGFAGNDRIVKTEFDKPSCVEKNDCAIFLGEVRDSYFIKLNGVEVADHLESYLSFSSVLLPVPSSLFSDKNKLVVEVRNLNNFLHGLNESQIKVDSFKKLMPLAWLDWFVRTGVQLASIYFLMVFSLVLCIIWFRTRELEVLYLLLYSIVSALYLFSFSEMPRFFFNPEMLSGWTHFTLRLIQDLALFLLFNVFFRSSGRHKVFYWAVLLIYLFVIGLNIFSAIFGIADIQYYLAIIKCAAPLVALPVVYGFYLALKNRIESERSVLVPITFILSLMQVNDLLVFWRLIDGYFTVRLYIPFIVVLLLYIYFLRYFEDYDEKRRLALKSELAFQLFHDIKSPAMALGIISNSKLTMTSTKKDLILAKAVTRIQGLVDRAFVGLRIKKVELGQLLKSVVEQKKLEYGVNIECFYIERNAVTQSDEISCETVFSNILNNALEASSGKPISVSLKRKKQWYSVTVRDSGHGVPVAVLEQLGKSFNTASKDGGTGLGLAHAHNAMKAFSGKLLIQNLEDGCEVELLFPICNP